MKKRIRNAKEESFWGLALVLMYGLTIAFVIAISSGPPLAKLISHEVKKAKIIESVARTSSECATEENPP